MKTFVILVILCSLVPGSIHAQKQKRPIDYRFKNGETGYVTFFSKNIRYPESAIENGTIGNSITRLSINPKGEIDSISVINPVDSLIDSEVKRAIVLSRSLWQACDTIKQDQVFYLQIAFTLKEHKPNLFVTRSKKLIKIFPEPVIIKLPEPMPVKFAGEEKSRTIFVRNDDLSLILNKNLDAGKYKEALIPLNELIKRDPFNRDLYKVRIMINILLNYPELVAADDNKLIDFAEGYSLDDLLRDQN